MLVLARDLLIASRIQSAVKAAGLQAIRLADPARLQQQPAALGLVVDLALPGCLEAASAWSAATGGHVAGVAPHVDTDLIRSARAAGIDPVLVRSQMDSRLPGVLTLWLSGEPG